jgi:CRISPR/Cas system CMR-associated protein Cmr5 small subunit
MASGGKEQRMVFDIRGRRKVAVKVVYALLAVLMGLSLFLVVGGFNLSELFNSAGGTSEAAKQFEEQALRIERQLKKEPQNSDLLVSLTRARVNAGNSLYEGNGLQEERKITPAAMDQLQLASDSWSKYLKATDEPNTGLAQLMSSTLFTLAQFANSLPESKENLEAAAAAQKLIADKHPSLNALTTLAFFEAILGNTKEARRLAGEAAKFGNTKFEKEKIGTELKRYEEEGVKYQKAIKQAEALSKAEGKGGKQALEGNPLGGFGGSGSSLEGGAASGE